MVMNEWYLSLEEPIRDIVKALRDNGINTVCSCGHEMYVQADLIPDGQLQTIHRTLFNYLAESNLPIDFTIEIYLVVRDGYTIQCFANILLKESHGSRVS